MVPNQPPIGGTGHCAVGLFHMSFGQFALGMALLTVKLTDADAMAVAVGP